MAAMYMFNTYIICRPTTSWFRYCKVPEIKTSRPTTSWFRYCKVLEDMPVGLPHGWTSQFSCHWRCRMKVFIFSFRSTESWKFQGAVSEIWKLKFSVFSPHKVERRLWFFSLLKVKVFVWWNEGWNLQNTKQFYRLWLSCCWPIVNFVDLDSL